MNSHLVEAPQAISSSQVTERSQSPSWNGVPPELPQLGLGVRTRSVFVRRAAFKPSPEFSPAIEEAHFVLGYN